MYSVLRYVRKVFLKRFFLWTIFIFAAPRALFCAAAWTTDPDSLERDVFSFFVEKRIFYDLLADPGKTLGSLLDGLRLLMIC